MDLTRPRHLLIALAALAIALPPLALHPTASSGLRQLLADSKDAKSASTKRNARKALRVAKKADRLARKADKRSKDALAVALAPVISQLIIDETITAADIATDAVESSEIAEGAVGSPEIGDGVVGSAEIADGAVGSSEIAEGAVGGSQIADGSVTGAEIAVGAVSSIELADESVQSADIFDETIASADIQDETIATFDILDNTIASVDILEGTIATGDISQSVWSDSVHAAGLLTNRPAAAPSNNGFLFFATDDSGGTLYRSNGSTWVTIGPGVDRLATSISMAFGGTWDNMPSALTEFMGTAQNRTRSTSRRPPWPASR